jgi:hypothetical protein
VSQLRRLEPKDQTEDLSALIAEAIQREPGDRVECMRIAGSRYRCNWWAAESTSTYDNPGMKGGQLATTHRIRQSRFIEVSRTAEGLVIREVAEGASPPGTGAQA